MPEAQVVEAPVVVTQTDPTPIEPSRITVVTNENFDSYVNDKLGTVDPEKAAAEELKTVEAEKAARNGEDDPTADLGEHVPKDKKGKLNERFSELTKARKEAEERATKAADDAKAAREAADKAAREAAELRAKYEPPKSDELGPEPQPAQFTDINEYSKALKDWTADKTRRDDLAAQAAARAEKEREEATKAWTKRQDAMKKETADYEDTIAKSDVKVSNEVRDAIIESEVGPAILYHLAKNPDVADKLGAMSTGRALRELGKLEASLSGQTKEAPTPAKTTVAEISKAPAPITPLRGASAPAGLKINSDGEFYGSYEEYKAARAAGRIK